VDSCCRTYDDAVGGFPGQYLQTPTQWSNLERQIIAHGAKADLVPIDAS